MRVVLLALWCIALCGKALAMETQLTFSPKNHDLDNNDNFSRDGQWLCYDTRETVGPGIDNCLSIEALNLGTGKERLLYRPLRALTGSRPAPGVGAVSFNPTADDVIFIHGPDVEELGARGPYGKPNRCGAIVPLSGTGARTWADRRDIATDRDTLPGAHRGGTHRHEYCADGSRIGFTYDDFLLPQYDRTIGCMVPSPRAPEGATHFFLVLVPVVPRDTAKPGEIEKAWGDSWAAPDGTRRAFVGKVRNDDGVTYEQSLFVVDIPKELDLEQVDSGGPARFPAPPRGTQIRRITHTWADGIVRGAPDGSRIAFYAKDALGQTQIFVVGVHGGDRHKDPAQHPAQLSRVDGGVTGFMRWHPSGRSVVCITAGNALLEIDARPGATFGTVREVLAGNRGAERSRLVLSPDGRVAVFNRPVPQQDAAGNPLRTYDGKEFLQIFQVPLGHE